jgi:hypothetical protein
MAVYKVPQDVEADDKLIGPFSFRQFIYLIIVCLAMLMAWGFTQVFVPLAIIPIPIILFFGALALPLRKDQPMEIYMAAMVSFYLKPHKRLWDPDGIDSLIEITVPKVVEVKLSKDISTNEAERRFSYLAEIVDTQGWAVRGPGIQAPNSALNNDVYFEAQQIHDIQDNDNLIAQSFDTKLDSSDAKRRDEMVSMMSSPSTIPAPVGPSKPPTMPSPSSYFGGGTLDNNTVGNPAPEPTVSSTPATPDTQQQTDDSSEALEYNPYPDIQQSVLQPADHTRRAPQTPPPTTSEKDVPPAIINLANNTDLSVAAIAREANRIKAKEDSDDGVYISLR